MTIRPVEKKDLEVLCKMIYELADFEKLKDKCKISVADLERSLFTSIEGSPKGFLLESEGKAAGYIITFYNYSTFQGKKGLYLEDLYVRQEFRRNGFGKKALTFLADFAVKNNCTRLEWSVLDWNTPAIDFYKSLGAVPMSEWTTFRLTGNELAALAQKN